ncbi:hypothetical protein KUH03_09875 [Sphingobacterium sp. E70]|uniref:hypothetical protein n=1 Tax=Sphingobacterium sp. E70 TaxID=2853439 RepID=UPI00211C154C|nr:hypothetical protein [Sphingobacterium sp. E70]ULT27059.1 hypothetical protein KUH03_09875 [Sphingobacterium sp. E70]
MQEKAPQQIAQDVSKFDLVRLPEPKITKAKEVTEDVATQDELSKPNTMTARITLKANAAGTHIARGEFGPSKKDGGITGHTVGPESEGGTDSDAGTVFRAVEVMPRPEGECLLS